jgi:hydrogenase maturation factor
MANKEAYAVALADLNISVELASGQSGAVLGPLADDLATASLDLARSFARGATMWCSAPEYPSHALHVAVEFVHPVIVGKRALPASPVEGPDPVATLRVVSAPGDILVALGRADDTTIAAAMRRAPAWGLRTVWIGTGVRPPAGAADHVLWLDEPIDDAAYGGRFVLIYHLLWELTHVCFEHPGLLEPRADDPIESANVCITCSDEGRVAEVVATGPGSSARVRAGGQIESIDITLIDQPRPGDLVLVHAGSAVSLLED